MSFITHLTVPASIYFIGLKGSGMCALAVLLKKKGHRIFGSDLEDTFYTDEILSNENLACYQGFDAAHIGTDIDAVVYSAAYNVENNVEMAKVALLGIPYFVYPEALGAMSTTLSSCAVVGTHGKTSSTAMAGTIAKSLKLPIMALTGGLVRDWDNNTFWYGGEDGFIAEVCEYRNHFEHFDADFVLFTSAELDHPDYFDNISKVYNVFHSFLQKMIESKSKDGDMRKRIIACGDLEGVRESIGEELSRRSIFYGEDNINDVQIIGRSTQASRQVFQIRGLDKSVDNVEWSVPVPGSALVLNVVGALVLIREWARDRRILQMLNWTDARDMLAHYKGVSRRCELLYRDEEYTILDDYGHHPTAISMTLRGIREFYQPKRLIVNFMPHTYSRTRALLDEFSDSFAAADVVICNDIYATPREKSAGFTGSDFVNAVSKHHSNVLFIPKFEDATLHILQMLRRDDVVVSMGAGDNFRITHAIAKKLKDRLHDI